MKIPAVALLVFVSLLPASHAHNMLPQGLVVGSGSDSFNWTGYEITSESNGKNYYNRVEATWVVHEPSDVISDGKIVSEVSTWVGLGGDGRQDSVLWQAGTSAFGDYNFWYEDYGCKLGGPAPCPNEGWPVTLKEPELNYGDKVRVVLYLNGQVEFYNLTTGKSKTYNVSIDNKNSGLSAEWVSELTCNDVLLGSCVPVKFNSPHMQDAYAYSNKMSTYLDIFNYEAFNLVENSTLNILSEPTKVNPRNHGFNVACCVANRNH